MRTVLLCLSLILSGVGLSQVQFWQDNLETATGGGNRTPEVEGGTTAPSASYFKRTNGQSSDIQQQVAFTGKEGTYYWAGEDHNAAGTGFGGGIENNGNTSSIENELQIVWGPIDITGKSTLTFDGLFAANSTGEPFDNTQVCNGPTTTSNTDYVILQYSFDGVTYSNLIRFFNKGNAVGGGQKYLYEDTDNNGCGDGTQLTNAFANFNKSIPGTGTQLYLRLLAFSESGNEEWAIDDFRLSHVAACTAPTFTGHPQTTRNMCVGAGTTTFGPVAANNATSFKWQVNTGSGFTDLANDANYSGVTTNTLTITSPSTGMAGQYRAVAINGVASCFTNSNSGQLNVSNITAGRSQSNVACNGQSNGAAGVLPSGGIGSYTYSWSPSGGTSQIASNLIAGTYTVTITDANSCQKTETFTITQPPVLNGSTVVTNVSCNGGNNGAINLTPSGGTPGYTFSWGGGITTEDRTSLAAGTYSVTITDANNCTRNVTGITVTQPTATISGTTTVTNTSCNGGSNGVIDFTPTGGTSPYTYDWGGGVTSQDRISLTAGTYSVTITDVNACTGTVSGITVTQPTAVSGNTTVTNTSCNGGTNGSIDLTPTGGTPGYTYSWGGGVTSQDRIALAAGNYSVTITDANGCTGTVSPTVTQPTAVSGTTVVTNVACFGNNTGAINLTPTGGTPGYTFSWGGGITTEDRTSLTAGTYSVTITDANGCTGTVSPTVTQPAAVVSGTTVVTNVACFGNNTGAINLTPTGGVGPYTFNWVGGATTEDRTLLTAGTYSVTITDANACTGTVSGITVTQPAAVVSGTTVVTNVACFGNNTGAINLTPTGGVGPYTFNWVGGATTEDRTLLSAGTYSVTITDANACTGTVSGISVTQPTAISVTAASQTNIACNGGSTGAAAINIPTGGTPGYTYNWTPGTPTGDGTTSVTGLIAGTWTCTVTDANGCVASQSFTVTQPTAISFTAAAQTNIACFGNATGSFTVNPALGGAGSFTYDWAPGTPTGDGTTTVTGLTAGAYSVTATDANSCMATITFTITQTTALSVTPASQTNVSCNGGSNGAAAINTPTGGAGGYTYNWTPGNPSGDGTTSVTGLTAGTYTVTVTDANACTASQAFTVTQPTAISVTAASQTNIACNGGSNGDAAINTPTGGTPGYTYDWTPGAPTGDGTTSVSGLTAGTYTVTVTDANGCTASQVFTVTQPTALSVTAASQTNISCNGGSNGAAAINTPTGGTGGYTYDWAPGTPTGDGTTSITGISQGTYTVTVTDANGCTASQAFTVTQPTALSVTPASQTNISCNGGSNGSAAINTPTGGAGGYTYDWAPGTPTGDGTTSVTGLTEGTYTVTVTDANGCTASQAFTVTQPTALSVSLASQTNIACNGGSTGAAAINTPTGGAGGYTYDWTPGTPTGDGTTSITALTAGTYTVTVTDANGCVGTVNAVITQPALITSTLNETACDVYTLNGSSYTSSGTYTQNLIALNGCDSVLTLNLTINHSSTSTLAETACDSFTLNGTTYNTSGVYTQVLENAAGCDSTITLTLTINQSTNVTLTETECSSYTLNGTTYNSSGVYTQVLENAAGCDSTITLNLTINQPTTSTLTETACDSFTLNGTLYDTTGIYTQVIENMAGCDSTITLNLTVNYSTTSTVSETACDSFTLNGTVYTASGVYTQVIENAAGCDSTITLTLTINQSTTSTLTQTVCESYTWTHTGITYTASGIYSDTLTSSNGCDSIFVLNLTVTGLPVATATNNGDATITASAGATYQWINCATNAPISGATAQTFTATANGSYAVIVSNGPSCSDTSNCVVINNVGLDENSSSFGVTLTPNPTQNNVTVTFTGTNEASIVIYDATGKIVLSVDHAQTGEVLSLEAFERGVYLVNILTTSGKHTERLVKQ